MTARPTLAVLLLAAAALACGERDDEPPTAARPAEPSDLGRHLRTGVEQLRRDLVESAAAELDRAAAIAPDDPQVLFHQARLAWRQAAEGELPEAVLAKLERAAAGAPDGVAIQRLLYLARTMRGEAAAADRHRRAIERVSGPLGTLEIVALHRAMGDRDKRLSPATQGVAPRLRALHQAFLTAMRKLDRDGGYAPTEAVPALERLFRELPELTSLRQHYAARLLDKQVRVNLSDRPDQPLMSSRLIADFAQAHFERAFDLAPPRSPMAERAHQALADIAVRMADWDDAVTYADILLSRPSLDAELEHRATLTKAVARYKQGRFADVVALLEPAVAEPELPAAARYLDQRDRARYRLWHTLPLSWLLHLAYDGAGVPATARRLPFRFRADLRFPETGEATVFTDIAAELGIDKLDGLGPSAWGDVDRDGDDDLYVSGCDSYGALYRNRAGAARFVDVSRDAGLFHTQSGFSATFADYDNDGWPDLYIGRDGWNGPAPNALKRNRGDGRFTDVTRASGLGDPGSSFVHVWLDADRDGLLDVFLANGITGSGDTNRLYHNRGDGTFRDVTAAAGLAEPRGTKTIGVAAGDYDRDGWPDLFVSGFTTVNRLYRNRGDGTFEEVAERAGVAGRDHVSTGYVCFFADFDNDGWPDILRTALAPWNEVLVGLSEHFDGLSGDVRRQLLKNAPKLYRNDRDGSFTDVSVASGLVHPVGIMGAGVADLDNDGYLDVYFGTGDPKLGRLEPDRYYRNDGGRRFVEETFAAGLGNLGKGHGVTFVDLDGDGDLEIYAPEGGFEHGDRWPNALYRNRQQTGNHWLHLVLEGRASNRDAVGARVTVTAGGRSWSRWLHGGRGFGSKSSAAVEFGLGRAERIDALEVAWPSGAVQRLVDVPADRRMVVTEAAATPP